MRERAAYRSVPVLPTPLDGVIEGKERVKVKATMLVEGDRRAVRCENMQVHCFYHLSIQSHCYKTYMGHNLTSKASEVR